MDERLEATGVIRRLLEQMIDLCIDLSVEVMPKYMSALTLMLHGKSYKIVGHELSIESSIARHYANCAVK